MGCIAKNGNTINEKLEDMGLALVKCEMCKELVHELFHVPFTDAEFAPVYYMEICKDCKLRHEDEGGSY